jgi:plasmid stabilization system protein ParE
VLTVDAQGDIDRIHSHIAAEHPLNAARFVARLVNEIRSLERLPERHPLALERSKHGFTLRQLVVASYRIIYRIEGDSVVVLTVRHGARRPRRGL